MLRPRFLDEGKPFSVGIYFVVATLNCSFFLSNCVKEGAVLILKGRLTPSFNLGIGIMSKPPFYIILDKCILTKYMRCKYNPNYRPVFYTNPTYNGYDTAIVYDDKEYPDQISGRCDHCGNAHFKSSVKDTLKIFIQFFRGICQE